MSVNSGKDKEESQADKPAWDCRAPQCSVDTKLESNLQCLLSVDFLWVVMEPLLTAFSTLRLQYHVKTNSIFSDYSPFLTYCPWIHHLLRSWIGRSVLERPFSMGGVMEVGRWLGFNSDYSPHVPVPTASFLHVPGSHQAACGKMFVCILFGAAVNKHFAARPCFCLQFRKEEEEEFKLFSSDCFTTEFALSDVLYMPRIRPQHAPYLLSSFLQLHFLPEMEGMFWQRARHFSPFFLGWSFSFMWPKLMLRWRTTPRPTPLPRLCQPQSVPTCRAEFWQPAPPAFFFLLLLV